ncbi:MAG TPA: hypothetical protein PKU74_06760 [Candidatus Omnitrophota bacterium]|nr:hypothetical protein [Candidatus Omnitrophota bacterium]
MVLVVLWQLALLGWRYRSPSLSEDDLFSLAAEEAVAAVFCKPNSFIETCNKGFEKLTGFSASELAAVFYIRFWPPGTGTLCGISCKEFIPGKIIFRAKQFY